MQGRAFSAIVQGSKSSGSVSNTQEKRGKNSLYNNFNYIINIIAHRCILYFPIIIRPGLITVLELG